MNKKELKMAKRFFGKDIIPIEIIAMKPEKIRLINAKLPKRAIRKKR